MPQREAIRSPHSMRLEPSRQIGYPDVHRLDDAVAADPDHGQSPPKRAMKIASGWQGPAIVEERIEPKIMRVVRDATNWREAGLR